MRLLALALVSLIVGVPFALAALVIVGLAPLAVTRAATAVIHFVRDMSWSMAVCGLVAVVILPALFIRARIEQRKMSEHGTPLPRYAERMK